MRFIIKNDIFLMFPDLRIGIVLGRGLQVQQNLKELENLIEDNKKKLIEQIDRKKLTDFTNIKSWRETYRKMGLKHKKYKPTVEKLVQWIIKGYTLPVINTSVNAYLAVELLTMLPISGYDLAVVDGDISLRVSKGGEPFVASGIEEFTYSGEFVYSDNQTILARHWNYRYSDHSKINENSTEIILISEAASKDIHTRDLIETLYKTVEYESIFCQGMYSTFILDKNNPEVELL